MRILFIHLGRENLGIEYLSALLKKAGHETYSAIDIGLFRPNDNIFRVASMARLFSLKDSILERFKKIDPHLVCFSAYSSTLQWCFSIAEAIKSIRDVPTVIGGTHITLAPQSAMHCQAIDYGVCGEAESVIVDFANFIMRDASPEDLPGLIYRCNGETVVNGAAPLTEDLDSLPFPDKTLFEKHLRIQDDYMVLTSRGCPYNCTYCCEHAIRKRQGVNGNYRVRSVDNLMEELNEMKRKYHFKEVFFCSPVFPADKEWIRCFSIRYRKEIGAPFWCFGHVNNVDEDYARMMRDAGCVMMEFGVQNVNETLRRTVLGRSESNQTIASSMHSCERSGIQLCAGHIFHLPGETEQDYRDAVRFYSQFRRINRIKTFNLTLFPGTRILDTCRAQNLVPENAQAAAAMGDTGDYFQMSCVPSQVPEWKLKAYENLLRMLPFLPRKFALCLCSDSRLKILNLIPTPVVKLAEMCRLAAIRDMRLSIYAKLYFKHLLLLISGRRSA
jgi:radical SAM superfamily enzyme YgiQ (UPF0313 family)